MANALIPPEEIQDPAEKRQPGIGMGRDPERAPMTWDGAETAGFTRGWPWLPLVADHRVVNVEAEETDGGTVLNLYRRLMLSGAVTLRWSTGNCAPLKRRTTY
jgi:alpha-glucosidase